MLRCAQHRLCDYGKVDAAKKGAVADVSILRDGKLIEHQQSRVFLARGGLAQIY